MPTRQGESHRSGLLESASLVSYIGTPGSGRSRHTKEVRPELEANVEKKQRKKK
uniref:Uncharacterized protein n=1 Tax=Human betaherpesvirus 6 TaxID=10368 RepID=A0A5P9VIX2_9BETA|nr:hypothetical protein [Human betaherpesvirus 6]QFV47802.1 hypothetical protein [Human betaherpesvirus 6]QFX43661.1 hypothetical protein [Human betaherpesvirus 6]QFX43682.1 hypothetical protein [Human betaherpesvirus 6]